jgi:hypothetical protein
MLYRIITAGIFTNDCPCKSCESRRQFLHKVVILEAINSD